MFGLFGKSLGHSFSKDYFTKKFSMLNLNHIYQNIELDNIADIIPFVKEHKKLKGFNVTVPYKEEIIPFLDEIDSVAKEVGAVNTVKIYEDGMLKGGTIYEPESGKTYYAKISYNEADNTITLRGSLDRRGWVGRSQTWIKERK